MKHIRKRLFALLITICILFGVLPTVFAGSGIVYDEDGGVWDFDNGIYTAPDGSTAYIHDGDPESGDDSGYTGTTNPDGSVYIYTGDPPDTTTPSSVTAILGYVTTIVDGVDLRKAINGYSSYRLRKGETFPYYHAPIQDGQYTWYYIQGYYDFGYVRNDGVSVNTKTGIEYDEDGGVWDFDKGTYTAPDGSTYNFGTEDIKTTFIDPWPDNAPEASYTTLKVGDSSNAVLELTTALKNQGYYNGDPTGTYSNDVASAIQAFQETIGITADGIASILTQHRLFGTIPIGAGFTSNLTMTIYPAEKVDWYNSSINRLWKNGEKYKIYDVQTGNVWWAQRNGGDYHVEAEPLTAADTARLCKSYGVYTAQELFDNNLWERRPILLTIGTRTFACSLYGIPHNYPNGDTIPDNDFDGQMCIYFTNCRTHSGNSVDKYHEAAINYALLHAPNSYKDLEPAIDYYLDLNGNRVDYLETDGFHVFKSNHYYYDSDGNVSSKAHYASISNPTTCLICGGTGITAYHLIDNENHYYTQDGTFEHAWKETQHTANCSQPNQCMECLQNNVSIIIQHEFDKTTYHSDQKCHWHICSQCGEADIHRGSHKPSPEQPDVCSICGATNIIASSPGHQYDNINCVINVPEEAETSKNITVSYELTGDLYFTYAYISISSFIMAGNNTYITGSETKEIEALSGTHTFSVPGGQIGQIKIYGGDENTGESFKFFSDLFTLNSNSYYPVVIEADHYEQYTSETVKINYTIDNLTRPLSSIYVVWRIIDSNGETSFHLQEDAVPSSATGTLTYIPETVGKLACYLVAYDQYGHAIFAGSKNIEITNIADVPIQHLPESLTSIESEAFVGTSFIAVEIPATVTDIASDAFNDSKVRILFGHTDYVRQYAEDHGLSYRDGGES